MGLTAGFSREVSSVVMLFNPGAQGFVYAGLPAFAAVSEEGHYILGQSDTDRCLMYGG